MSIRELNADDYRKRGKWGMVRDLLTPLPADKGYDLICQRIPLHRTGYALAAPKDPDTGERMEYGKYETNHCGVMCIQVEIEGYADDTRTWSYAILDKIAQMALAPIGNWIRQNGYPDFVYKPRLDRGIGKGSYGIHGAARMSWQEWQTGIRASDNQPWNLTTHQEVPLNEHYDCGQLDIKRIADTANSMLVPVSETQPTIKPSTVKSPTEPVKEPVINQETENAAKQAQLTSIMDQLVEISGHADDLSEELASMAEGIADVYQQVGKLL